VVAILDTITFASFPDSLLGGSAPFRQDLRRVITRLNGHLYLWCRCRLAIKSNKRWRLPSEYPSASILPWNAQTGDDLCDHPGWNS